MSETVMKPNVVFILGLPGAGKGTQSKNIVQNYNFAHLSAGDLLREELTMESSVHRDVIQKHFDSCSIVPVEITCALIKKRMDEICGTGISNFLIDGFPRNWDNFHGWERMMSQSTNLVFVLNLEAPSDLCVDRCLHRCDGSGRTDDNMECLEKRLVNFTNDTLPVLNHYRELGLLRTVNGANSPSQVFEDIKALLESVLSKETLFLKDCVQEFLSVNNNRVSFTT